MTPSLMLWAAAVLFAAVGLRARRGAPRAGAAAGTARPGVPAAIRLPARIPVPAGLAGAVSRDGDAGAIVRAGLGGVLGPMDPGRARAGGAAAGAAVGLALGLMATPALVLLPVLVGLGLLLPGRALAARERERRRAVVRELPDLLDLLGICVEAGMALDPALELASGRLGGVLGEEIGRVLRDLSLGTPRAAAYRALTERVGAPEIARTVGALLQAEELGAPLSRALEGQAEALRASRRQDARERAARAAP
ncbi:MAG: type II secretion system F family protein, partial [Thermoleophilia bacterium]